MRAALQAAETVETDAASQLGLQRSMVIEVVGRAGVGKSAVCRALRDQLTSMGESVVSRPKITALDRVHGALWVLRRPWLVSLAWTLARWTPVETYGFGFWSRRITRIDRGYAQVRSNSRPGIRIEDEGLFHYLKRTFGADWSHWAIDRLPRPDMVIILSAAPRELVWRKAHRGRLVSGAAELSQEQMERHAARLVRAFLEACGEEDARGYLSVWSRNCLGGRLPADRFDKVLAEARSLPSSKPDVERQESHLRAFLRVARVKWCEVENANARSAAETASEIVEIIKEHVASSVD